MTLAIRRVRRGMKLLDNKKPGWEQEIDLGTLHLSSCSFCVLGQLYRDYERGCAELNLDVERDTTDQAPKHGFEACFFAGINYELLDEVWKDEISKRVGA